MIETTVGPLTRAPLAALLCLLVGCAGLGSRADAGPLGAVESESSARRQILVTVELKSSWRSPRAGTSGRPSGAYRPSARTRRVVSQLARTYDLREVSSWPIRPLGVHCVVFEIDSEADADALLDRLTSDRRVESAQPMNRFETSSSHYNDPYLGLQHGVSSMEVEEAHRWARGAGIEVAVVDTGVDLEHPELRDHIRMARDFVADDGRPPSSDLHGTAVAGVIVSAADNEFGIVGVAPAARILALKACWQETPDAARGVCNSFTLAKALTFAVERRPHVLNLSLAGPSDPLLERLIGVALADGMIVVAAAGDTAAQPFPVNVEGVLGVRAAPAEGSPPRQGTDDASLLAPGAEIITTSPAGGFDFHSGNSLASAHVTGVVALLLERQPDLSAATIHALLRESALDDAASAPGRPAMVNACVALSRITTGPTCRRTD